VQPPSRIAGRRAARAAAAVVAVALSAPACAPAEPDLGAVAAACADATPAPLPGESRGLVLVNAYWLQEEAARAVRRGDASAARVEEALGEAAAMGAAAVRTNGFNDDPGKAGDSAIQVAPLAYDEVALRGLDLVLARAAAHRVRLVLTLGNHWDAYGGARQYVAWAGLPSPATGDPRFYSDRRVVDLYRAHVTALLSRVSTVDGIRYGEHPAVLAWELLNEPRAGSPGAREDLHAWVRELAALVKSLAPGHLVGTGEEGNDEELLVRNAALPDVDYASVHLYPAGGAVPGLLAAAAGAAFLDGRLRAARAVGKPLVVGEFGLRSDGPIPLDERRAIYRGWLACLRRGGGAAAGPWMLAHDDRPEAWDPFAFKWWDGTPAEDPANSYVDLLRDAAAAW
jgi:mannan endo-1,4-beta-mannosidase